MDRQKLVAELKRDEALRLKPYRDTEGKLTIGIGRNLDDVGISEAEAAVLVNNDIDRTIADLDAKLPWWRQLDEVRQRVLVNMCFNMGIGNVSLGKGLLSFVNTLAKMKAGDYQGAADGMRASKWAGQVGARAERLIQMMRTGAAA